MAGTKIYIFIGHYGSGKTETAVNFARKLRRDGHDKVALLDLDIVNPFFRSADARDLLESEGVHVEAPIYAGTNVDMPALTGSMGAYIEDPTYDVVLDIGGDDVGAKAVARYADAIHARDYEQFFVVNTKRPFTETLEYASRIYDEVEASSCCRTTGIINNSNLMEETTADVVEGSRSLIDALAARKGVPVAYYAVTKTACDDVAARGVCAPEQIIPIERTVKQWF